MAIFRKLHTTFWSDTFIGELDRDKKLFYIYLLTNERTTQCGIYEISKKQIAFDLGYSIDTVSKLLIYFINAGKIRYNEGTNEMAIGNWVKYNFSTSPKVQTCVNKELKVIKDTLLIQYLYCIDTHPQEEEEEEEEQEQEEQAISNLSSNLLEPKEKQAKEKKFIRPTLEEVIAYFDENGYSEQTARVAFNHYDVADWKDVNGNKVRSWKQKMSTVWFKDDNKKKDEPKKYILDPLNVW